MDGLNYMYNDSVLGKNVKGAVYHYFSIHTLGTHALSDLESIIISNDDIRPEYAKITLFLSCKLFHV